jgi:hypothetical protein
VVYSKFLWITLFEASGRLTGQFGFDGQEMVRRAMHSHEVPIRAREGWINNVPTRIEKLITSDMTVDIDQSSVISDRFRRILWRGVEISWAKCLEYCKANLIPNEQPALNYKPASNSKIISAIRAEYDEAEAAKRKPPNIKEIVEPVQSALRCQGFHASGNHIQELAKDAEFKNRRRRPGATVKSDRHPQRM